MKTINQLVVLFLASLATSVQAQDGVINYHETLGDCCTHITCEDPNDANPWRDPFTLTDDNGVRTGGCVNPGNGERDSCTCHEFGKTIEECEALELPYFRPLLANGNSQNGGVEGAPLNCVPSGSPFLLGECCEGVPEGDTPCNFGVCLPFITLDECTAGVATDPARHFFSDLYNGGDCYSVVAYGNCCSNDACDPNISMCKTLPASACVAMGFNYFQIQGSQSCVIAEGGTEAPTEAPTGVPTLAPSDPGDPPTTSAPSAATEEPSAAPIEVNPTGGCCAFANCTSCLFAPKEDCYLWESPYFLDIVTGCEALIAGGDGDPHIRTWNGVYFDYHGECDLVMVEAPDFEPHQRLDLHVRTKIRFQYSYITSAALRIGDDVVEVSSWGNYAVNEVDSPTLEGSGIRIGGYPVYWRMPRKNQTIIDIKISDTENITMGSWKDMVFVKVTEGTRWHFGKTMGLMGNFAGEKLARDGETDMSADTDAFGQEWQVRPEDAGGMKLFMADDGPQYPTEKCRMPSDYEIEQQANNLKGSKISHAEAAQACARWTDNVRREGCISDVLAVGDLEIAGAGVGVEM